MGGLGSRVCHKPGKIFRYWDRRSRVAFRRTARAIGLLQRLALKRFARTIAGLSLLTAVILLIGFGHFTASIARMTPPARATADGIVVLTGGEDRISAALGLLDKGQGRRLLISGADIGEGVPAEMRRWAARKTEFDVQPCCIDLGFEARSTAGNAREAARWAQAHGFASLIVVTTGRHMPRSIAEFRRAMPGIKLIAHPVRFPHSEVSDFETRRRLQIQSVREYGKFVVTSLRHGASRLLQAGRSLTVATLQSLAPSTT